MNVLTMEREGRVKEKGKIGSFIFSMPSFFFTFTFPVHASAFLKFNVLK